MRRKAMITTPIYYVNAAPHIGHLYTTVLADALNRWNQLKGIKTLLTTGTDEHGLKVQDAADAANLTPIDFCDKVSGTFKSLFNLANVDYGDYIRTTEPRHKKRVQDLWTQLQSTGWIYMGQHEAWYSKSDESFLTESQVEEREDGVKISKESKHVVERISEQNYKFRLSAFQTRLSDWLEENPNAITPPSRYAEVKKVIDGGLHDISVSRLKRKIPWGIPVPSDDTHTIYVWLDALTNYLSCEQGTWPPQYQIVGKDILKFHAIYWPAFLMAANLPLPQQIVAHGHWTVEGIKMSKSLGNVVDPVKAIEKYGVDPVRYFLLREGHIGFDSDFSFKLLEERCNAELADTFGNLLSRSTGPRFVNNQVVPMPARTYTDMDMILVNKLHQLPQKVEEALKKPNFVEGISHILDTLHTANKYFSDMKPWKVQDDTCIYLVIETIRMTSILLQPVIPDTCSKVLDFLQIPESQRTMEYTTLGAHPSPEWKIQKTKIIAFQKFDF